MEKIDTEKAYEMLNEFKYNLFAIEFVTDEEAEMLYHTFLFWREYAQEFLRSCAILDDNNKIVPIYKDIITENKSRCHKCVYELNCLIDDRDSKGKCPHYKRDASDGGYYR